MPMRTSRQADGAEVGGEHDADQTVAEGPDAAGLEQQPGIPAGTGRQHSHHHQCCPIGHSAVLRYRPDPAETEGQVTGFQLDGGASLPGTSSPPPVTGTVVVVATGLAWRTRSCRWRRCRRRRRRRTCPTWRRRRRGSSRVLRRLLVGIADVERHVVRPRCRLAGDVERRRHEP